MMRSRVRRAAVLSLAAGAMLATAVPGALAAAHSPVSRAGRHPGRAYGSQIAGRPGRDTRSMRPGQPTWPGRSARRDRPGSRRIPAGDEIVTGAGDLAGWHLYAASSGDGWRWHALATLRPAGREETWIGQQCLTGDGRYVIAVVAPWHANNSEPGIDAGGFAYAVNAHTGQVRPLASGVSLAYFNPGCGTGSQVAFTTYLGQDERTTRVSVLDAATGTVLRSATVRGEVTSAVPAGGTITGARGGALVQFHDRSVRVVGRVPGQAFDLRPAALGGIGLLAAAGHTARIWRLAGGTLRPVGAGPLGQVRLLNGRAGHDVVTGATTLAAGSGLVAVRAVPDPVQAAASLDGRMVLANAAVRPGTQAAPGQATLALEPGGGGAARVSRSSSLAGPVTATVPALDLAAQPGRYRGVATAGNTTTPACAVPRDDLWNQVPQPNSAQIQWAVGQAVHGWLTPGNIPARPPAAQNYQIGDSQPLPSYYPSQDFPPGVLSGSPGVTVPPQVMYGIFAQESNWNQASFHALAGYGGNPLIANYYGSSDPANPADIDYDNADCGYGLGQLTDIMKVGALGQAVQVAVATDYTENIAAAVQALVFKWNQLAGLGITMNNGDPSKLENWYAAIWAYNSGVHLTGNGDPANGLGWFNNPANPVWLVGRHPFLHTFDSAGNPVETFTDASTPQDWPYQEKVFGWMETPQFDPNYDPNNPTSPPTSPLRYAGTYDWADGTGQFLSLPPPGAFCSPGINNCTPSAIGSSDPCPSEDSSCWWDAPAQWADCTSSCTPDPGAPPPPGAPEPAGTDRGIPCSDTGGLDPNTTIVDDSAVASQNPSGLDPNVVGCPTSPSGWSSSGSFELDTNNGTPGQPGHQIGVPDVAGIDLHQLGAGFGGHIWFTHTRPASDAGREVVGVWRPGLPAGIYRIKVYVPSPGATTTDAAYQIHLSANGPVIQRTINQNAYGNQWVSLGLVPFGSGGYVTLGSVTPSSDASQGADIAFDAMAFTPVAVGHGITISSSPGTDYQFGGWGTSLAWWAEAMGGGPNTGAAWQPARQAAVEHALFDSPAAGGLGLTVLRYNIGASPVTLSKYQSICGRALRPGAQVPSPQQASGGAVNINNDAGQLSVLNTAIADIEAGGGSPTLEAFANSPPFWMTGSGCPYGGPTGIYPIGSSLSSNYYDAYPAYLTRVLQKFEAAGLHFQTVEPFNEPWSFPWQDPRCDNSDPTKNSCQRGRELQPRPAGFADPEAVHRPGQRRAHHAGRRAGRQHRGRNDQRLQLLQFRQPELPEPDQHARVQQPVNQRRANAQRPGRRGQGPVDVGIRHRRVGGRHGLGAHPVQADRPGLRVPAPASVGVLAGR